MTFPADMANDLDHYPEMTVAFAKHSPSGMPTDIVIEPRNPSQPYKRIKLI
jgi:hypothetical protein